MSAIHHTEWLNENAGRSYPIKENASRVATSGVELPNFLIVDFVLTVSHDSPSMRIYVSTLTYVGTTLSMIFSDANGVQVSSITVNLSNHTANTGYELFGADIYSDVRGRIVLGDLENRLSSALIPGQYDFDINATEFEISTIRPAVRLVKSLRVKNGANLSDYIFGHTVLSAGDNIDLTYIPSTNEIRITARPLTKLVDDCSCNETANPLASINALTDTVNIVGDECITVETDTNSNTITIKDSCSKPCCTCPELDFLRDQLTIAETSMATVQNYANVLEARISEFITNYVLTVGS